MSSQERCCKDCGFWREWTHNQGEEYLKKFPKNKDKGDCLFNAPAVAGLSEEGYACWPDTKATDWCGEFQERVE